MNESWFDTRERLRQHYGRNRAFADAEKGLEFTANTTRELLSDAVRAMWKYGDSTWLYVRDFDDNWVIFDVEQKVGDDYTSETYRQGYSITSSGAVTLADDREQVRATTTFVPVQQARAFKTEIAGKTLLTAPATTLLERAATPNPHFLHMQGRFVGAEKANRNGALWTVDDLSLGQPTVKNGPLNWLHEDRHIIGAITESTLVQPAERQAAALGALTEPFIAASAAIWRWLWPDEAAIVEQAASQQRLWYSMECISDSVVCEGLNGCGAEVAYQTYLKADEAEVCEHVRTRASVRRFKDPTFLGGAVIVPPVRPGWADAHAELMTQGELVAEAAYEQAGRPDMKDREWAALMAQVVSFAQQ